MDKKKTLIKWGMGTLFYLVLCINIFISAIGPLYEKGYRFIKSEGQEFYALPAIGTGDEIRQSFIVDADVQTVEFAVGTFGNQYEEGFLEIGVCERGNSDNSYWSQIPLSEFSDNAVFSLKLGRLIRVKGESECELVIRGNGMLEGQQIALLGSDGGSNRSRCQLNGIVVNGTAFLNVYIHSKLAMALTAVFWLLAVILYAAFFLVLRKKNLTEHKIYFLLAIVLGIGYMLVLPPGVVVDEFAHYNTARYYSDRLMGMEQKNEGIFRNENGTTVAYVTKRAGDRRLDYVVSEPDATVYGWQYSGNPFRCADPEVLWEEEPVTVTNAFPGLYMGAAVGLTFGRLLCLGDTMVVYMGRLFQYAQVVFLIYMAIRLTPRFKNIFLVTALLPVTMYLSASYSYDGIVIAFAMFYMAICLRMVFSEKTVAWKEASLLILAGGLLAPGKVVYVPLCLLCLIIPTEKFKDRRTAWTVKGAVLAVSFGMFLFFCRGNVVRYANPQGIVSTKYSVGSAFADFPGFIHIMISTVWKRLDSYFTSMVGGFEGYNIKVPATVVMAFTVLLAWAVRRDQDAEENRELRARLFVAGLGIFTVVTMLILATGYTWTDIGETVVRGLQGRYWLPVLPLLLMSFRFQKQKAAVFDSGQVAGGILVLHAIILFTSMEVILGR